MLNPGCTQVFASCCSFEICCWVVQVFQRAGQASRRQKDAVLDRAVSLKLYCN